MTEGGRTDRHAIESDANVLNFINVDFVLKNRLCKKPYINMDVALPACLTDQILQLAYSFCTKAKQFAQILCFYSAIANTYILMCFSVRQYKLKRV